MYYEIMEDRRFKGEEAKKTVFNNARHMENFPCIARHAPTSLPTYILAVAGTALNKIYIEFNAFYILYLNPIHHV